MGFRVMTALGAIKQGTVAAPALGSGFTLVRKGANETVNNSAAMQNDNDLFFAIGANEVWEFTVVMFVSGIVGADFAYQWTAPAGAAYLDGVAAHVSTVTSSGNSDVTLFGSTGSHTFLGTTGTGLIVMMVGHGTVVNGTTPGTMQLQWAQQTATVGDTIMNAGSYLLAHRLS